MSHTPRIAYTLGEPAGIGTDIVLQLAANADLSDIEIIGDQALIHQRAEQLGLINAVQSLRIHNIPLANPTVCGTPDTNNVPAVLQTLDTAIEGCLKGHYQAMVTGPLHKGIINEAGIAFSGHTEYLAEKTGSPRSVMLLASPQLRVALQTTHLPLRAVSDAITYEALIETIDILQQGLQQQFGLSNPRIVVCGLNPHAGEGGHLGKEEINTIQPAIEHFIEQGLNLIGPVPADTAFTREALKGVDAVLAMYHDQGLPVLKSQGFGEAANVTLGLPIIRTSVDHGTALSLAGKGTARTGGLTQAIRVARQLCASAHA